MTGISHKLAQRYLRMDLDGLLSPAQHADLETHLRDCEVCRSDSESLASLTMRLQTEFHAHWNDHDGPSKQVLENVRSQTRRIMMQKRLDFVFNVLGGAAALLLLFFVINSVVAQLQKKSAASNGNQTATPVSRPTLNNTVVNQTPTYEPIKTSASDRLIAYVSEQDGNKEIYTMKADGSDMTNLTNNPTNDFNPVWSPDGTRIAFTSNRNSGNNSQIFLMNADGSNVIQLTKDNSDHLLPVMLEGKSNLWSPDGSKLLYLQLKFDTEWGLQSMDINSGNITPLANGRFDTNYISWSPDGKSIAFVRNDPVNTDTNKFLPQLNIVSASGANLINVTGLLPSGENLSFPINYLWSGDGQSVFFIASNMPYENVQAENYTWKVYQANLNGTLTTRTTTRSPISSWWNGNYLNTPFGSNGWTWVHSDGSIKTINSTQECEQEQLYDSATNSYTSALANFSQSPNGNGVIVAACPDGKTHLSWVNSTGTEITPLVQLSTAPDVGYLDWVLWSKDDQFIAFRLDPPGSTDAYVYLVNIGLSIKDPSIAPVKISLGKNEHVMPMAWQPIANNDVVQVNSTPKPTPTFRFGEPVETKEQALIAAYAPMNGNFNYVGTPVVVKVQKGSPEEFSTWAGSTSPAPKQVWVVVYYDEAWKSTFVTSSKFAYDENGAVVTLPPDMLTPPPPFRGCVVVVIDASNGHTVSIGGLSPGYIPECDK